MQHQVIGTREFPLAFRVFGEPCLEALQQVFMTLDDRRLLELLLNGVGAEADKDTFAPVVDGGKPVGVQPERSAFDANVQFRQFAVGFRGDRFKAGETDLGDYS
ncbi:MAG TPA: hypothetical protein P5330_10430 [Candidatus Competibacteraceae bacterium]|nr:hypothetical protein [Candidatus Competibacteraceae bacterium]